ncbi:plasmid recombination protein [Blautia wexlerae]|uniref:plasmid recombination protein n=1 Tax=Blautia wexlerae TaxID=418240 RepID=UPI0032C0900B
MRRTISGMIGTRSLAHNRRDFIAENVDPDRVHLNICYQNENLKEVYKELFDDSVERYNVGKRKDRQITNYYEKIRQGKQEKLFHEVIFQIGNREDMAVGTTEGDLAVKVLDEYVKNFQKRNPTLHVFSCYLHQDEATPHLHIDFVPYVTGWKGKGMDTRVSLKQALKSLGFQGGNKHDTELNQWINHEKELLAEIARQHRIEWEQKGTHEEHLDVYNFKKKECRKEVQALEQEKEYLTAENEGLTAQIAEVRADIQLLKDDKEQAVQDKEAAEKRAEKAEKDLHSLEERRERLQPVMDNVSKETKQAYNRMQRKLDTMREEKEQLSEEKQQLQGVSDRYDRVVRVLGENVVEDAVQKDIQEQKALEEKRQVEQMPKGSIHERLAWGARKSEMENQQRKKNKTKNRGMER